MLSKTIQINTDLKVKNGYYSTHYYPLGTTTYICDFHREQAWERWLKKGDNGVVDKKGDILKMLRAIAKSNTVDAFEKNLSALKQSDTWLSHQKLRNWMNGTWLKEAKV